MSIDFPIDSVLTEITFWKNRENSLKSIEDQLELPEVKTVLNLLKKDSAMSSIVFSFRQNINLVHEIKKAQEFNMLLQDCPINPLISAKDLKSTLKAINDIFEYFKLFKKSESYPIKRLKNMIEALSKDSSKRILKILEDVDLMTMESKQFLVIKEECYLIFTNIDKKVKALLESVKNKNIKRKDKKEYQKKLDLEHSNIQGRLDEIADHRKENEKLLEIVSSIFSEESDKKSKEAIKDIQDAYTVFLSIKVLNMSIEGENRWQKAKKKYNLKIDRIEEEITTQMRDRLASAETTNEMFRTFSKFNALFSRPRIRGAIQEYQNQILTSIKKDIKEFRNRFLTKYNTSEVCKMYKYRHFPSLSGLLTWYNQLERKLDKYLGRIKDVLGTEWQTLSAGKQLKAQIDPIIKHLDEFKKSHLKGWIDEMNHIKLFNNQRVQIFKIIKKSDGLLKLDVNFSKKGLSLYHEKSTLKSLGERFPHTLLMKAQEVQMCFPFYISLVDSLATFHKVNSIITSDIAMLLATKRTKIHTQLKLGAQISWKDERNVEKYTLRVSVMIQELEDSTQVALEKNKKKDEILKSFEECDYNKEKFKQKLEELQRITDDFVFNDYSNIFKWVSIVNSEIEKILTKRAEETIQEWMVEFENYGDCPQKYISLTPIHEIKIRDRQLVMDPTVQEMRSYWYKKLNGIVSIICGQKKIESTKYDKGTRAKNALVNDEIDEAPNFRDALKKINQDIMFKANQTIEGAIKNASSYVSISGCQALWNVDFNKLYEKLQGNVPKWHFCLGELQNLIKRNFDSAETVKHFGAVVIDYQKAQDQVNNRFNSLQEGIIKKLYEDVSKNMSTFYKTLTNAKSELEIVSLDNPNIDVTIFITEIQEKKRLSVKWEKEIEDVYEQGVNILKKKYPIQMKNTLNIDNLRGAWGNFKQILAKKVKLMDDEMDRLREKVISEEKVVNKKIEETKKEWIIMKEQRFIHDEEGQDVDNSFPDIQNILNFLSIIEGKAIKLKNDWKRVCKAKELLDMDLSDPEALDGFEETIRDHKNVWAALSKIWNQVLEIGDTLFAALNPKKIKENLRSIFDDFIEMPTKYKQYDAFEDIKSKVSKFQSMQNTIIDLKGEAMKQRHWTKLLRTLRIKVPINELSIMDLWKADLISHKVAVGDIMAQAIGENAIDRFLTDVKDHWSTHELDLVKYVSYNIIKL